LTPHESCTTASVDSKFEPPLKRLLPRPVISMIRGVRRLREFPRMEMHGLPRLEVEQLLASLGARIVDVVDDRAHGADTPGFRYCAVKVAP
jgi:hypothetical protein